MLLTVNARKWKAGELRSMRLKNMDAWAGQVPRYYKFYLLKNGEILSESSQGIDSCMINFKLENERHFKFDICRNKTIE